MARLHRCKLLAAGSIAALTGFNINLAATAASITNGGFNTDLTGWAVVEQPSASGSWFFTEGGTSALGDNPILTPSEGDGYAHSAQTGQTSQVLFQDITLEADTQHLLSFDWFAQDWSNNFVDAGTLDFTGGLNQHLRVDLVPTDFTDWFGPDSSTGVLTNILAPVAELSPVDSWNSLDFDLTPWAGQAVRLAFRQVDNQLFFNAGVDDVSIVSTPIVVEPPVVDPPVVVDPPAPPVVLPATTPQAVPEPGVLAGLAVLGLIARKKSHRRLA